jgi:hypothetical protein
MLSIKGIWKVIVAAVPELYLEIAKHRSLPIGRNNGLAATLRRDPEINASQGIAVPLP